MHCYCETEDSANGPAGIIAHFDCYPDALLWAHDEIFQAAENYGDGVSLRSFDSIQGRTLEVWDNDGFLILRVCVRIREMVSLKELIRE